MTASTAAALLAAGILAAAPSNALAAAWWLVTDEVMPHKTQKGKTAPTPEHVKKKGHKQVPPKS